MICGYGMLCFPSHIKPHEAIYPGFLQPIGFIFMVVLALPTFTIKHQPSVGINVRTIQGSCGYMFRDLRGDGAISREIVTPLI